MISLLDDKKLFECLCWVRKVGNIMIYKKHFCHMEMRLNVKNNDSLVFSMLCSADVRHVTAIRGCPPNNKVECKHIIFWRQTL